jgi:hypothetical protein
MRYRLASLVLTVGIGIAAPGFAAEEGHAAGRVAESVEALPHPTVSADGRWAGALTVGILFMFVAAAVVGAAIWEDMPEELPPPAHSHDEPPGASHHHGPGGTAVEDPHH